MSGQIQAQPHFVQGKNPSTYGGQVGPLTGLNGFEEENFVCPAGIRTFRLFNS
jgi:hypothetical protein